MNSSVSEEFHQAGQRLVATLGENVAKALRQSLNQFLAPHFEVVTGKAVDADGQVSSTFGALVCTAGSQGSTGEPMLAAADVLACAIDVCETLDLEGLRAAYQRVAQAKMLKKSPVSAKEAPLRTNVTLGIIFAIKSSVPLEVLAEELDRLNQQTPGGRWTNMVVVLTTGTIGYAGQFHGEQALNAILPPAEGALKSYIPPIYVVMVMSPTAEHTLNKMCVYLAAHLAIFLPGANLSRLSEASLGVPNTGITMGGYQYNLRGELLPVPRQFYSDRYLPPSPMLLVDGQGDLLCTLQFVLWQDGGVILLRGKLPLEGLLVFLGKDALRNGIIRRGDLQLSYVLAITRADFLTWLGRIQRQSNLVVKSDPRQMVVQKFADEGVSTPVMARLFMEVLRLRDQVFPDQPGRNEFDQVYEFVLMEFLNTRTTAQTIARLWAEHARKVSQGEIARMQGRSIQITEAADQALNKEVQGFLNGAVRVLKHGMQDLAKVFQVDIGFLFQKQQVFESGLKTLEKTEPLLADYLKQVRPWSERLLNQRNAIEHDGWQLPNVRYSINAGAIEVAEPEISGQKATEFVKTMLDRLMCFVEEVTVFWLQGRMARGVSVTEVSPGQRTTESPGRFRLTLANGGMPVWRLSYHQSSFEEV